MKPEAYGMPRQSGSGEHYGNDRTPFVREAQHLLPGLRASR